MKIVNIHEAKTHLSRLVREDVIARDGRPIARVTPILDADAVPRVGFLADIAVPDDFDDMARDQIADMFGSA